MMLVAISFCVLSAVWSVFLCVLGIEHLPAIAFSSVKWPIVGVRGWGWEWPHRGKGACCRPHSWPARGGVACSSQSSFFLSSWFFLLALPAPLWIVVLWLVWGCDCGCLGEGNSSYPQGRSGIWEPFFLIHHVNLKLKCLGVSQWPHSLS